MNKLYLLLLIVSLTGCSTSKKLPRTLGDLYLSNQTSFGYHPLDPLPVEVHFREIEEKNETKQSRNKRLMNSLPDETMRLAIGEVSGNGGLSFGPAEIGYKGKSYIIILDYIKFDTKSFPGKTTIMIKNDDNPFKAVMPLDSLNEIPEVVIPVYVGVGLRLSAIVTVHEGKIELGNLFALGAAAEAKKISGTLVIQTLGISGEGISALIPIPSEINNTTIQNAILSIGAIKSKIYEDDIQINPRIVGIYNNVGGNEQTINSFISNFLSGRIYHKVE